ncbi:putative bromodomain-containing protein 2 [Monocercomonoides exilis]|uniref:putative bromodomain-containing protein 2 n=1 Tax=Monocercomonoides exilis TaxID=2049356 RepID=UPI00355AA91E|nr:putative bromodomain-containing protein 2 [Monocercomonoides exilis]|eukprot:MONOS_840.1-p1 / transcript=MONOS_840.1 / gene=MONOS_840 / organism=Monocercomonoides_exilis_PA203 / gene_product=unspecified product / transcript_product=unspecified product / location=Mono_scaffold00014:41665-43251(-) / protein_length=460 / sequence_SO=supercontig / SO=protein_coding / is_pseudo=false
MSSFDPYITYPQKKQRSHSSESSTPILTPSLPPMTAATPSDILRFLSKLVQDLIKHKHGWPFATPVDVDALSIPQYREIIKKPMDLGTIKMNIENGYYEDDYLACYGDIVLVWDNCFRFNPPDTDVSMMCSTLQKFFLKRIENSGYFTDNQIQFAKAPHPMKYQKPTTPGFVLGGQGSGQKKKGSGSGSHKKKSSSSQKKQSSVHRHTANAAASSKGNVQSYASLKQPYEQAPLSHKRQSLRSAGSLPDLDRLLYRFEGDEIPLSNEEMVQLVATLDALPERFMEKIVQFIQQISPMTPVDSVGDDVIEFSLDDMDVRVVRHLQKYVEGCVDVIQKAIERGDPVEEKEEADEQMAKDDDEDTDEIKEKDGDENESHREEEAKKENEVEEERKVQDPGTDIGNDNDKKDVDLFPLKSETVESDVKQSENTQINEIVLTTQESNISPQTDNSHHIDGKNDIE